MRIKVEPDLEITSNWINISIIFNKLINFPRILTNQYTMPLPCLVITCPGSEARQTHAKGQLNRIGQEYELLIGVEGRRLTDSNYFNSLRQEFSEYLPSSLDQLRLGLGEAGCYLSFIRALRRAQLLESSHILIVEDDVEFLFDDPAVLDDLRNIDLNFDQLKLSLTEFPIARGIPVGKRKIRGNQYSFYFYWRGLSGNTCTIISQEGIAKLLKHCPRFGMIKPFDALVNSRRYFMDFVTLFARPQLARESVGLASSIQDGRDNSSAFAYYIRKEGFWARKRRQLRHLATESRTPIASLWLWLRKSIFIWYCLKHLLWKRKKPTPTQEQRS